MHCFMLFQLARFPLRNQLLFSWFSFICDLVFPLLQLSVHFLCSVYLVFSLCCEFSLVVYLVVSVLFVSIWMPFLSLGQFSSGILLKICSVPLTWDFSCMLRIQKFVVVLMKSHMFLSPGFGLFICLFVLVFHLLAYLV